MYHAEIHRRLATVSRRRITLDPISAGVTQTDKLGGIGQIKLPGYAKTIHIADFFFLFWVRIGVRLNEPELEFLSEGVGTRVFLIREVQHIF